MINRFLRYQNKWELIPSYAGWIAPIKNSREGAFCKYCNIVVVADVIALDSHAASELHMSNIPNSNYQVYKAKYKKTFQRYWLRNPLFMDWLEAVSGATSKARCKLCKTYISARHSSLLKHSETEKHKKYSKKIIKDENNLDNDVGVKTELTINNDQSVESLQQVNESITDVTEVEKININSTADHSELESPLKFSTSPRDENSKILQLECEEVDEKCIDLYLNHEELDQQINTLTTMIKSGTKKKSEMESNMCRKETRYSSNVGYKIEWESDPLFKDWLSRVNDDNTRAQCIVCLHRMASSYTQLVAHANSLRHRVNMKETTLVKASEDESGNMHDENKEFNDDNKSIKILDYGVYREEWEEDPKFKDWVRRVRNINDKASCRYCGNSMLATTRQLVRHLESERHKRNCVVLWNSTASQQKNVKISEIQKSWENDPLFKDWIKFIENDNSKVECRVCLSRMFATRYQLLNHIGSKRHQLNTADNVQKLLLNDETENQRRIDLEDVEKEENDIYNDPSDPFVNNNIRVKVIYRNQWQDDPHLKDWISGVPETDRKAFCKICNQQMRACYPVLRLHARAPSHLNKMIKAGFEPTSAKKLLNPVDGNMYFYEEAEGTEDNGRNDGELKSKIKNKFNKLGYQFNWEKDDNFKDWIVRIKNNDHKVGCRFCRSQMSATLTQLHTHMSSDRHNMKVMEDVLFESNDLWLKNENDDNNASPEFIQISNDFKEKTYKRRYRKIWEKDHNLKDWIMSVPGYPYKAMCKICSVMIAAKLTTLIAHSQSTKHLKRTQQKIEGILPETKKKKVPTATLR